MNFFFFQSYDEEQEDPRFENRNGGRNVPQDARAGRTVGRRGERQDATQIGSRLESKQSPSRQQDYSRQIPSRTESRREPKRERSREEVYRTEIPELVRHQPKYPEPKPDRDTTRQGRGRFVSGQNEDVEQVPTKPTDRTGRPRTGEGRVATRPGREQNSSERIYHSRNNNPRQPQRNRSEEQPRFRSRDEIDDGQKTRGRESSSDRGRQSVRPPKQSRQSSMIRHESPDQIKSTLDTATRHRFQSRGNERTVTGNRPDQHRNSKNTAKNGGVSPPTSRESDEILLTDSVGTITTQPFRPRPTSTNHSKDVRVPGRSSAPLDRGTAKGPTLHVSAHKPC